jgi:hypothetical protein
MGGTLTNAPVMRGSADSITPPFQGIFQAPEGDHLPLDYFAGLGCGFWSGKTPTDGGVAEEPALGAAGAGAGAGAAGVELEVGVGLAGGDVAGGVSAGGAAGGGGSACRSSGEGGSGRCGAGLVPGALSVSSMLCTWRVQSFSCSTSAVLTASGNPGSDARIDQCPSVSGA